MKKLTTIIITALLVFSSCFMTRNVSAEEDIYEEEQNEIAEIDEHEEPVDESNETIETTEQADEETDVDISQEVDELSDPKEDEEIDSTATDDPVLPEDDGSLNETVDDTKGLKTPPSKSEISISSSNGKVLIRCDNTAWLKGLVSYDNFEINQTNMADLLRRSKTVTSTIKGNIKVLYKNLRCQAIQ